MNNIGDSWYMRDGTKKIARILAKPSKKPTRKVGVISCCKCGGKETLRKTNNGKYICEACLKEDSHETT